MGWNLGADDLQAAGVTEGAPLKRWNRDMLRFARPTGQDWAEVDPELAAGAVTGALEIVRAVASAGGMPAVVANDARLLQDLWLFHGIPTLAAYTVREGFLAGLPPSEERLARLHEWPSRVGLNADDYIEAARIDMRRERTSSLRTSPPEPIEQPDLLIVIGGEVSSVLLAETKEIGIPLVATVGPEADPTQLFWVIPGNFNHESALADLISAVRDYTTKGQIQFEQQLERYGKVKILAPFDIDIAKDPKWVLERTSSPQSSVDADEVIAAWDN